MGAESNHPVNHQSCESEKSFRPDRILRLETVKQCCIVRPQHGLTVYGILQSRSVNVRSRIENKELLFQNGGRKICIFIAM